LGSMDMLNDSYKCANDAKPSLACTDLSLKPTCFCTCSNGVMFDETLPHSSHGTSSCNDCEAEKN
ncbi:hypothetical protein COCVIDRAFT_97929, partial [Bipolaris victoriae FI3]